MVLRDWLKGLEYECIRGSLDTEVSEVVYDSRKAAPGAVFVCMAGTRVDSHRFVPDVLKAGVRVLVTERGPGSRSFRPGMDGTPWPFFQLPGLTIRRQRWLPSASQAPRVRPPPPI